MTTLSRRSQGESIQIDLILSISDFSSRPWRILPPTWVIHLATRRPAHNTPIHMDLGPFSRKPYKKFMWIGVLWAGLDHPSGWQVSPWPAKKTTENIIQQQSSLKNRHETLHVNAQNLNCETKASHLPICGQAWANVSRLLINFVHVDQRVVGWSAGRHVDHPCGWQFSPWHARKVSVFAKRGTCKRGFRKLDIGHHRLHSNHISETWSNHDCHWQQ